MISRAPWRSAEIPRTAWTEVEQRARAQLVERGEAPEVLAMLAISLQMQGRVPESVDYYARLTRVAPDESVHWGNYAMALRELGRVDEAARAYAAALAIAPLDAEHWINYGLLLLQQEDYVAAHEAVLKAHSIDPLTPWICIHAARACNACREYDEAQRILKRWRTWLPLDDDLQQELAELVLSSGDGDAAVMLLEDLVRRAPERISAKVRLASTYERLNRLPEAAASIASAAVLPSAERGSADCELAHVLARLAQRNDDSSAALTLLESAGPRSEHDFAHYFSLAEVYASQGRIVDVMQTLRVAHAVQSRGLKALIPQRFEPKAHPLPLAQNRVATPEFAQWPQLEAPDALNSPVFIVGFPRSGTTLLEQMLDAHPLLQSMDENPFFNRLSDQLAEQGLHVPQDIPALSQLDCNELRRRYLAMVDGTVRRRNNAQIVDKNPLNLLWMPFIHRLFPNAKFILALRHPCDVVLSCYMQNFRSPVLAAACSSLERLATAYVASMESWLYHERVFLPSVLVVRNEDVIANLLDQAAGLGRFLDLDDEAPLLGFERQARRKGFIGTPSYAQVIQPVNDRGVGRWLRYREYIDPVLPILEPMLKHWGYRC